MEYMIMEYDPEADATYFKISDADIVTTRSIGDGIMTDLDATGGLVGVEVLCAPKAIGKGTIDLLRDSYPGAAARIAEAMAGLTLA